MPDLKDMEMQDIHTLRDALSAHLQANYGPEIEASDSNAIAAKMVERATADFMTATQWMLVRMCQAADSAPPNEAGKALLARMIEIMGQFDALKHELLHDD